MKCLHYPSRTAQAEALAELVANQIKMAIAQTGVARIALSGGSTPQMFLTALDKVELPWENVRLTLTDERQVPLGHPRSNLSFVCSHLPQVAARVTLVPLCEAVAGQVDFDALAQRLYQQMLPLDVCVLGMGEDGHFASLFPAADNLALALDPDSRVPVLPVHPPSQPEARVSLTLAALLSSAHLHLLIQGERKRQVLATAANSSLPIATLLAQAGERLLVHDAD